jgi:hypothetical protein
MEPWGNEILVGPGRSIFVAFPTVPGAIGGLDLSGDGLTIYAREAAVFDEDHREVGHWYQGQYPGPLVALHPGIPE